MAAAEASFREKTAGKLRPASEWQRTAKAWLAIQKPAGTASDKGTLLPSPFMLGSDMVPVAMKFGLTESEVREATAAFVDEYRSATGFKAHSRDWNATWRQWMRSAADRKKRAQGFQKPKGAI